MAQRILSPLRLPFRHIGAVFPKSKIVTLAVKTNFAMGANFQHARKFRDQLENNSVQFFFAEFLKARISPERIEHWIELKQRRSERTRQSACVRYREQFL